MIRTWKMSVAGSDGQRACAASVAQNTADSIVQDKQEGNGGVHVQDADKNNDDKEKHDSTEEKSNVTFSMNRETQDNDDRDSKEANTIIRSQTSFQAVTCRSWEILGSCQRWNECRTRSSSIGLAQSP